MVSSGGNARRNLTNTLYQCLCPDLVSGIVRDAMSKSGWRQRLIRKASLVPARYVLEEEQPCVVYKGRDLHFEFAFTTEEAAYAWESEMTPKKRPRGGDYAITMRVTGRALADVTIGEYVRARDYDPKDTDSVHASWDCFCSTVRPVGRVPCSVCTAPGSANRPAPMWFLPQSCAVPVSRNHGAEHWRR